MVAGCTKPGCSQASLTPSLQPELLHECQVAERDESHSVRVIFLKVAERQVGFYNIDGDE